MGHIYSEVFMEHLENTRNVGEIENPDGIGKAKSDICGDFLRVYINVENDIITDIKFKVYGCATAIAGGSVATELAKGMRIDDAMSMDENSLHKILGDLPERKISCLRTVIRALHDAVKSYLKNKAQLNLHDR